MASALEEIQEQVAFKLGEASMEDEALMEILSIGRADLITHLIERTVNITIDVVLP